METSNQTEIQEDVTELPLITVVVPCYNHGKYLRESVESLLAQTYKNLEIIVVNDGSTDNTLEVLKSYGNRITLLQQENQGPETARSRAAAVTDSEYFVLLDSDDLLLPHSLATYDKIIRDLNAPPVIIGAAASFQTGTPVPESPSLDINYLHYRNLFDRALLSRHSRSTIHAVRFTDLQA